jgi:hypothetical protein
VVAGHVVDTSGAAVGGAIVSLRTAAVGQRFTLTDENGAFSFARVQAGTYVLDSSRAGYLTATSAPDRAVGLSASVRGSFRTGLTLTMVRLGRIGGAVIDEAGEPLPGVEVTATLREAATVVSTALGTAVTAGRGNTVRTDERGRYKIRDLMPGTYALQTSPLTLRVADPDAVTPAPPYRMLFYPATTVASAGGVIDVTSGGRVTADFAPSSASGVSVIGVLSPPAPQISLALVPLLDPAIAPDDPRVLQPMAPRPVPPRPPSAFPSSLPAGTSSTP